MLASPEDRRAIKDSRGKCRSRWLGHHTENARPQTRTFSGQSKYRDTVGSRTAYGQNADIRGAVTVTDMDCPRTACGRGCGHGLDADMARLRTGHGPGSDTDCPWLRTSARPFGRTDCGFTATISRTQKPRFDEE